MIIVETSVWVDYFADTASPQTAWLELNVSPATVGLTDLTLTETLQGVRNDADFRSIRKMFLGFPVFNTGGAVLAIASAEHYRWLRKRGMTVRKTIDCLIATFCIREGYMLLHNDRDFDPFETYLGLKVFRP